MSDIGSGREDLTDRVDVPFSGVAVPTDRFRILLSDHPFGASLFRSYSSLHNLLFIDCLSFLGLFGRERSRFYSRISTFHFETDHSTMACQKTMQLFILTRGNPKPFLSSRSAMTNCCFSFSFDYPLFQKLSHPLLNAKAFTIFETAFIDTDISGDDGGALVLSAQFSAISTKSCLLNCKADHSGAGGGLYLKISNSICTSNH
jgi:hypothetical protein